MSDEDGSSEDEDEAYRQHVAMMQARLERENSHEQSSCLEGAGTSAAVSPGQAKRDEFLKAMMEDDQSSDASCGFAEADAVSSDAGADEAHAAAPAPVSSTVSMQSVAEVMAARLSGTSGRTDKRGSYDRGRPGVQFRRSYVVYAWEHLQKVTVTGIASSCKHSCPFWAQVPYALHTRLLGGSASASVRNAHQACSRWHVHGRV
eukprot:6208624-Pleurochrysis_carterae.AAC.2